MTIQSHTLAAILVASLLLFSGCSSIKSAADWTAREIGYIIDAAGNRPVAEITNAPPALVTAPR